MNKNIKKITILILISLFWLLLTSCWNNQNNNEWNSLNNINSNNYETHTLFSNNDKSFCLQIEALKKNWYSISPSENERYNEICK